MSEIKKPNLTDSERRAYEQYLLADTEQARQEAIARLVPGSAIYYHLYFLDRFRLHAGKPFSTEEANMICTFQEQYLNDKRFKEIKARWQLLSYDYALGDVSQGGEKRREKMISDIVGEYLYNLSFNPQRPDEHGDGDHSSNESLIS